MAHRQTAGHWAFVGETRIDVDDLDAALAGLKAIAVEREGAEFETLLVLPDDQILYTSFMAPTADPALTVERIEDGLDGLTPYPVADLVYDYRAIEDDRVKVAVAAAETLEEARSFAGNYGFKGVGFAAMPPMERFPGLPIFAREGDADLGLTQDGLQFGADRWGQPDAPAPAPALDPVPDTAPAPEAMAPAEVALEPEIEQAEPAGDTTDTSTAAPQDDLTPEPDVSKTADPVVTDVPKHAGADTEDTVTPLALEDLSLSAAIMPLDDLDKDDLPELLAAFETETDADPETGATPNAGPGRHQDPKPDSEPLAASTDSAPKKPAKPLKADKAGAAPAARTARFTPTVSTPPDPDDTDDVPPMPSVGFSARRGKAPAPSPTTGRIVGARSSRLGFGGAGAGASDPVLHPDAAVGSAPATPSGARPSLKGQLSRVRDAAKSRPKAAVPSPAKAPPAPMPPAGPGTDAGISAPLAPAARTAFDAEPKTPSGPSALQKLTGAVGGLAGGLRARRSRAGAAPAPEAATATRATGADSTFTTGLLARKPAEPAGPSLKTGLILTLILLVLLAAIAIWSVLFLPDSPMARLFSPQDDVTETGGFDGPAAPDAVTAPPGIGLAPSQAPPAETDEAALADPTPDAPLAPEPEAEAVTETVAALTAEAPVDPVPEADLPDIDADLELPPLPALPPLPQDLLPSLEETERIYADDGIWPRTPDRPTLGPFDTLDGVYIASIDPAIPGLDAIALPDAATNPGELLRRVPPPPPFGSEFSVDALGLVAPTPEGVLTPEGAFVIAGQPPITAVQRPRPVAPALPNLPQINVEDAILGTFRPTRRPGDLGELRERQLLGGLTVTELAGNRPTARPVSAQEAAASASLFPGDATGPADAPETISATAGTALAVASSRMPRLRPANIEAIVAAAASAPAAEAVPASVAAPQPSIPSNASVTRAATERNAIRLRDVNLIGVTGSPSDRRALVRLPSGRFVRVAVGDRLDGGTVAAIGEASLQYVRRGQNITLDIPG